MYHQVTGEGLITVLLCRNVIGGHTASAITPTALALGAAGSSTARHVGSRAAKRGWRPAACALATAWPVFCFLCLLLVERMVGGIWVGRGHAATKLLDLSEAVYRNKHNPIP